MTGFTQSDIVKVCRYLGYSPAYATNGTISTALAKVAAAGDAFIIEVQDTLRELDKIQEEINESRLGAGQTFRSGGSGTVQYAVGARQGELRSHGRNYAALLSQQVNLSIVRDLFDPAPQRKVSSRTVRG